MADISVEFTYNVPDKWLEDTFNEGKTATYTYVGPEYLTFQIDNETGREVGWCLIHPEELERPTPLNVTRVTVDCEEEPLLCEIANDVGREDAAEMRFNRTWSVDVAAPEGYEPIEIPDEYEPRDYYDEYNITYDFDTDEFNIPIRTWKTLKGINPNDVTWDHFRAYRNNLLKEADGRVDSTMPQEFIDQWVDYKTKLRDAPAILQAAGVTPFQASLMLPPEPEVMEQTSVDPFEDLMGDQAPT